jgi:hypothetical protein
LILDYSQAGRAQNAPAGNSGNPATTVAARSQTPATPDNNASSAPGLMASALSAITNIMNLGQPSAAPSPTPTTATGATASGTQPALAQTVPLPAAALAPEPPPGRGGLILAGLGFLLALGGLAVLFFWRMRSAPRASVITESFNQTKK